MKESRPTSQGQSDQSVLSTHDVSLTAAVQLCNRKLSAAIYVHFCSSNSAVFK